MEPQQSITGSIRYPVYVQVRIHSAFAVPRVRASEGFGRNRRFWLRCRQAGRTTHSNTVGSLAANHRLDNIFQASGALPEPK